MVSRGVKIISHQARTDQPPIRTRRVGTNAVSPIKTPHGAIRSPEVPTGLPEDYGSGPSRGLYDEIRRACVRRWDRRMYDARRRADNT